MISVTTKDEMERKSEWLCGVKFLKLSEKTVFEQKFSFSLVVFCLPTCGNFTMVFTVFQFFGSDFFLNGFPNLFKVHSKPSVC